MPRQLYSNVTHGEEKVLVEFLTVLEKINPKLHEKLSQQKWLTLLFWIFRLGCLFNSMNYPKKKTKQQILKEQNEL